MITNYSYILFVSETSYLIFKNPSFSNEIPVGLLFGGWYINPADKNTRSTKEHRPVLCLAKKLLFKIRKRRKKKCLKEYFWCIEYFPSLTINEIFDTNNVPQHKILDTPQHCISIQDTNCIKDLRLKHMYRWCCPSPI